MITSFLSSKMASALAWTLVHSLWQFALVAMVLFLLSKIMKKADSNYRYFIGFAALGICFLMSLITFAIYYTEPTELASGVSSGTLQYQAYAGVSFISGLSGILTFIDSYILAIVNAWLIGSLLFFLKFTGAYLYLKSIIKQSKISDKPLYKSLKKIKAKLDIHRNILLKESIHISTPMVIGYIKPVILFPIGLINQLTTEEVNAILAHELAHIKRHDYLFNLIQICFEIVFYYNPAIWYISSRIRMERENCCDDIAVAYSKNNFSYARTLVKLQELNIKNIEPAMAFAGGKNSFSNRILRLLNQTPTSPVYKDKILVAILLFTTLFVSAKNYHTEETVVKNNFDVYVIDDCPQAPEDIRFYLDTIPERNSFHIKKRSHKKDLELEMENGTITRLKIDGREVPQNEFENHASILKELIPDEDKDIITLFPECGDDFGKVYLLEKMSRKAVNMDSVLETLKSKNEVFSKWKDDVFYGFNFDDYDNIVIDTIRDEVSYFEQDNTFNFKQNEDNSILVDSIWDLVPHKFPKLFNDQNLTFKNGCSEWLTHPFFGKDKPVERLLNDLDEEAFFEKLNKGLPSKDIFNSHKSDFYFESSKVSDLIVNSLLKNGLIDENGKTEIELTGKFMKIDGDKQAKNIWNKYKKIYEEATGIKLSKDSKIKIDVLDSDKQRKKKWPF